MLVCSEIGGFSRLKHKGVGSVSIAWLNLLSLHVRIELHGGIYKKLRHPGAVGEMPLYVVIALFVNSLFLAIWLTAFILVFTPIHIYYEEKDLLKRFGEEYAEYRRRTPAVFPGLKRHAPN